MPSRDDQTPVAASSLRFLLFAGDVYYPLGGWEDFAGGFDTLDEAKQANAEGQYTWAHVLDRKAGVIVAHRYERSGWKDGAPDA